MFDLLNSMGATFFWMLIGVAIFTVGIRVYDFFDPIDYHAEIKAGNVAAAIKLAAVILGLAAITVAVIVS